MKSLELRRQNGDMFLPLLAEQFEGLHDLRRPPISLKLKCSIHVVHSCTGFAAGYRRSRDDDSFDEHLEPGQGRVWTEVAGCGRILPGFTDRDSAGFPFDTGGLPGKNVCDELTLCYVRGVEPAQRRPLRITFERDTASFFRLYICSGFLGYFSYNSLTSAETDLQTCQHDGFRDFGRPRLSCSH